MSPAPVRMLLLGYGTLGLELLRGLLADERVRVVGVFPWPWRDRARDEHDHLRLGRLAATRGLTRVRAESANSARFERELERLRPDCVLVGAWGEILRRPVLSTPEVRFVNCHPSLLPAHRGPNPYASVILEGASRTGVTFHLIDARIDTGPVLVQRALAVDPEDTGATLRLRCARAARALVPELVTRLDPAVSFEPIPQSALGEPSYFPAPRCEDGWLGFGEPAERLHARVRALTPWVPRRIRLPGAPAAVELRVARSEVRAIDRPAPPGTVLALEGGVLSVATGDPERAIALSGLRLSLGPLTLSEPLSRPLVKPLLSPGRILEA